MSTVTWLTKNAIALGALVVSSCALGLSMYTAYLEREHKHLSVEPFISISFAWSDKGTGFYLGNVGLGPALIRSFSVFVDKKRIGSWGEFQRLLNSPIAVGGATYAVLYPGEFIPGGQRPGEIFRLVPGVGADILKRHWLQDRILIQTCYCSVYRQCWISQSHAPIREPIGDCPPAPRFEVGPLL